MENLDYPSEQIDQAQHEEIKQDPRIKLSQFTVALIHSLKSIHSRSNPDEMTKLSVSQTVSFLAIVYEKIRNAVEYREEHLIRRAAIERILRRRFALHPDGAGVGEDLLRELMWARYFPNGSLDENDIATIQKIIDKYLAIRNTVTSGHNSSTKEYLNEFIIAFLTCEIEETLSPEATHRYASLTYFIFQTLREKIKIDNLSAEQKDAYFLVALEKSYRKSDKSYERYHLFTTFYKPLTQHTEAELKPIISKFPEICKKIDQMISNPYATKLFKFINKQLPPFLVLFDILQRKDADAEKILADKEKLWIEVEQTCRDKYEQTKKRLHTLAFKSLIYIFITKMALALILEYPVSLLLFNEVNWTAIAVNTLFPPALMLLIVFMFKIPGKDNTQRIYQRIVEIVDEDKSFETRVALITKKIKEKRPILIFGFTIMYSLTFFVTLFLIYQILTFLQFNIVSQVVFVFFVSIISFFSYRMKSVLNEYRLVEKESIFTPVVDFFFMPMLSIGKFLSTEVARFNFFILLFDFIIEAPFKLIIEVVEEWISFVKARKDEIV